MRTVQLAVAAVAMGIVVIASAMPAAADTDHAVRVSQGDPFATCTADSGSGTNYPGTVVEPMIAVDPARPDQEIGVFQQDRWSNGASKGLMAVYSTDGGQHFSRTTLPFSSCAPGGLPYGRASDPWVSFGPDGTAYASGLNTDFAANASGIAAATSYDGGRTWRHATQLIVDISNEFVDDKNSVTADPLRVGTAYQVWDRLDFGPNGDGSKLTGPALMSTTHDDGRTWGAPTVIVDTAANQQTIGNIIVADRRTGVLYDFFDLITYTDPTGNTVLSAVESMARSVDGGRTWSKPTPVATDSSGVDTDPNTGAALRTGALPSVAIDPEHGTLYLAYEGTDFTGGTYDQIQLVHSTDGGRTWSAPVRVNGAPHAEAFTPTVAVNRFGTVAVSYYDLRALPKGDTTTLPTIPWLAVSAAGGESFSDEQQLAPAFDMLKAPVAGGYFLGDYQGLASDGIAFHSLFVTTTGTPGTIATAAFAETVFGDPRPNNATALAPADLQPHSHRAPPVIRP